WHLIHFEPFAALRECPRLVVRLGLDGAVLWQFSRDDAERKREAKPPVELSCRAWLVYDPQGIEGTFGRGVPGKMVAGGSAFTAAFVHHLANPAKAENELFDKLLQPVDLNADNSGKAEVERLLL